MKRLAIVVLLWLCGCGVAVSPTVSDGAADASVQDVLPPCPTEFPGQSRCPRAGMRCSVYVTCLGRSVPCVCEDTPPYPYPRWQGSCIVEPCS